MRSVVRSAVVCAAVYVLLILPWPGFRAAYDNYFLWLGNSLFGGKHDDVLVEFVPASDPTRPNVTVAANVGNIRKVLPDGSLPVRQLQADARGIGWIPSALFLALTIATPLSLSRKCLALACGFVVMQLYLAACIGAWIWGEWMNAGKNGATLPFWTSLASGLNYTLVMQMGASFVVPVIIWVAFVFAGSPNKIEARTKRKSSGE